MTPGDSDAPVRVGEVVADKYRVERVIGAGGMGVVVAAHHLTLDEPVAMKFVSTALARDREVVERTLREARATFRLRSPHTVRMLDAGELPSGRIYLVMELLAGRNLQVELAERGALPESEVVSYALQVCSALEEAHALGIVHRDLKPQNLFLAEQRRAPRILKVLDFGLSKVDTELFDHGPLTQPETQLGTPRYMAPEQWRSATGVDARADIWALGVVMYELATGAAPLQGVPLDERKPRLLAGAIPSPRETRAALTEGFARVVMRCLRADPEARWPSAVHLATALRAACPGAVAGPARAEITRTDVTAVVPPAENAERVARAFGAGESAPPSTHRETPQARDAPPSASSASTLSAGSSRARPTEPGLPPPSASEPAARRDVADPAVEWKEEHTAPVNAMRVPPVGTAAPEVSSPPTGPAQPGRSRTTWAVAVALAAIAATTTGAWFLLRWLLQ